MARQRRTHARIGMMWAVALATGCLGAGVPPLGPAPAFAQAAAAAAAPVEPRGQTADLPGVNLFYLDSGGKGPVIVLMHAGTGSARVWEHQWGPLTKAGYRVIAIDRRGYGRTTVKEGGPVSTAADDLDALMTHLKVDRFHLVGTAAGGMVATDYAISFSNRLRSLVIANSIVGSGDESYQELGRRLRPSGFEKMPPDFRELGPAYRAANPEGTRKWLELEHVSRAPGERPPAQPWKNKTTFDALAAITAPTLLLTGDADLYTPPPALRLFAQRIPKSQTLMLREVGHSGYWEQPDQFNRAVLDFIKRHK